MKKYIGYIFVSLFFICIILVRTGVILTLEMPVDGDEAVFGLMTKYIFEGKNYPIFVWKAHYVGTISCYITALIWKLFGVSIYGIRYIMIFWEILGIIFFSYLFKIKWFIPLIFVFLPARVLYYANNGLYMGELFSFGVISLFLLKIFVEKRINNKLLYLLFGFINGFGLYHHPLYLPFFLTSVIMFYKYRIWENKIGRSVSEIGFVFGLLPLIVYNVQYPLATFKRLVEDFYYHRVFFIFLF